MKTVIHLKTEKEIKKGAQDIAEELGLSLSAVINTYLREFIRNRELHISVVPKMTPSFERLLRDVETDIAEDKNLSPAFTSGKEMDDYLAFL